jgi:hypothetical protein
VGLFIFFATVLVIFLWLLLERHHRTLPNHASLSTYHLSSFTHLGYLISALVLRYSLMYFLPSFVNKSIPTVILNSYSCLKLNLFEFNRIYKKSTKTYDTRLVYLHNKLYFSSCAYLVSHYLYFFLYIWSNIEKLT